MIFDPSQMPLRDSYQLLIGSVVPRPIAFISSIAPDGTNNLAPFSFYMGVSGEPPTVAVAINRKGFRRDKLTGEIKQPGIAKDSLNNIETTREFVINLVNEEIAEAMNKTSADYPAEMDEFQIAGLTPVPSVVVKAPRVAESPINMECKVQQIVYLGQEGNQTWLVVAEVLRYHIKDDFLNQNGTINLEKLHPVGRLSGNWYSTSRELFELIRPVWKP